MKFFSDCSGPCETCRNSYKYTGVNCLAGHGDDFYEEVKEMNSEKVRVNLRRLADLAADGHQDVMDALAALNSSIIKAEEGDWNSIRVKTVERRFKEALNDCGVQQERMERIGEEITAIRQNMRISS
jgi:hypothetical protein